MQLSERTEGMTRKILRLPDFPRGGRIIQLGEPAVGVASVWYINENDVLQHMPPESYLHRADRIILAVDCWPHTSSMLGANVFIGYDS